MAWAIGLILVLLPFHAVFTTWLGATVGHIDLFRIWKELLLIPLASAALWLVYTDKRLKSWLQTSPVVLLAVFYILLHLLLGLRALNHEKVNTSALIYALLINLRFLVFFGVCFVVAAQSSWLYQHWRQLLLVPATVVIIFGLLQQFVLPANILSHIGYGPRTIPAFQSVDQKPDYIRIQSTLRGPNPLGAYLVLVITTLAAVRVSLKKKLSIRLPIIVISTVVLFFTYSRSAWLGLVLSLVLLFYWSTNRPKFQRLIIPVLIICFVILSGLTFVLRDNNLVQNALFHTDETSRSAESSNAARALALESGAASLFHEPFGRGPGTAGPASFRNDKPARIAENYFIQIGQEVGVIGLGLFVAINVLVIIELWKRRLDLLAKVLLASLIGITFINLLSHAWADDTLAYIWWGLAGIALSSVILNPNTISSHLTTRLLAARKEK